MSLEVASPSVVESEGAVTVFVRLSQPFSQNIQFTIDTSDVTATGKHKEYPKQMIFNPKLFYISSLASTDYLRNDGVVTLPAGSTEIPVSFTIIDDNVEEVNAESFRLSLNLIGQPNGVVLRETQGTVTITDDDSE